MFIAFAFYCGLYILIYLLIEVLVEVSISKYAREARDTYLATYYLLTHLPPYAHRGCRRLLTLTLTLTLT